MTIYNHITGPAQVYVGTYRKYNNGNLTGAWLELDDFYCQSDFIKACEKLHSDELFPELMFQDYENIPPQFISESHIDSEYWDFLNNGADYEAKVAFIGWYGSWDAEAFEEAYQGEYDSPLDFTYQFIDDIGYLSAVPEEIARYFDYEAFSRDLFINDYSFIDGFVFLCV